MEKKLNLTQQKHAFANQKKYIQPYDRIIIRFTE